MEHESNDWSSERVWMERKRRTAIRAMAWAKAPFAREDGDRSTGAFGTRPIRDDPGQNAPRAAPVADELPRRQTGQQRGFLLGGSTSRRHGLQGQAPQDSGVSPPPPTACPVCHNTFFFGNAVCTFCACAAAIHKVWAGPIPEDQRCPACRVFAGRAVDGPRRHVCRCDVCRFFHARVCPDCVSSWAAVPAARMGPPPPPLPYHEQEQPLALGFNNTRNLLQPASGTSPRPPTARWDSAVAWRREGPPPNSGIGALSRHSCSPATSSWGSITSPAREDAWCPACLYYPAPTLLQPSKHVCVCKNCKLVDGIVCQVCTAA